MHRRDIFKALALVPLFAWPLRQGLPDTKYGEVDVHRFFLLKRATGHDLRTYVNGEDVTDRCYLADDVRGIVRLFKQNPAGGYYLNKDDVVREIRYGHVAIVARRT